MKPMPIPARFRRLFEACADAGGRALVVGGAVRDHARGVPAKDLDVEVHGIEPAALEALLGRLGRVSEVGKSFGVYKLRLGGDELDVSVPRRDRQAGRGHKSIVAEADPHLGVAEAARRRDLTINAIAYDPLTGVYEDPYDGLGDLTRGRLRAVDPATFVEDPLRALRVAQFAGRFGYAVDPELLALCRRMPLHDLPAERILGEVEKLLTRSRRPSVGWQVGEDAGLWAQAVPAWSPAHPERGPTLDRVADAPIDGGPRRLAALLAAACTGLGPDGAERALDRLNVHRQDGYRVREQVLALVTQRARPPVTDEDALRAAEHCELELLAPLLGAPDLAVRAAALGVVRAPLPPLLAGRDLVAAGMSAGPDVGVALAELREAQLSGRVTDREQALAWARARAG